MYVHQASVCRSVYVCVCVHKGHLHMCVCARVRVCTSVWVCVLVCTRSTCMWLCVCMCVHQKHLCKGSVHVCVHQGYFVCVCVHQKLLNVCMWGLCVWGISGGTSVYVRVCKCAPEIHVVSF